MVSIEATLIIMISFASLIVCHHFLSTKKVTHLPF